MLIEKNTNVYNVYIFIILHSLDDAIVFRRINPLILCIFQCLSGTGRNSLYSIIGFRYFLYFSGLHETLWTRDALLVSSRLCRTLLALQGIHDKTCMCACTYNACMHRT